MFLTNAVLCLKDGGIQAKVRPEWFSNCGARFLRPTIDLIAPKVLVSHGEWAYKAITAAYALKPHSVQEGSGSAGWIPPGKRHPVLLCTIAVLES